MGELVRQQRAELLRGEREQQRHAELQMVAIAAEYSPARNLSDAGLEVAVDQHGEGFLLDGMRVPWGGLLTG